MSLKRSAAALFLEPTSAAVQLGASFLMNNTMSASRISSPQPFVFTVICPKDEVIAIEFFAVPQFAAEHIGDIRIDWGDGNVTVADVAMSSDSVAEIVSGEDIMPTSSCSHRYAEDGKRTVTVSTPSGFLPLKKLPYQTVSVATALPTLTMGESDPEGRPEPSDTLPPLFAMNPKTGRSPLNFICPDFLANNPNLAFFDEAFMGVSLKSVPVSLFSPCKSLKSLARTFAHSQLTAIPYGLLRHALTLSLCEETFAHCSSLRDVDNPFGDKKNLPVCLEGFMQGAAPRLFAWCDKGRRQEAGWIRPHANLADPCFEFDWHAAPLSSEPIVLFYPIDLELEGDLFVEWGDGAVERIDWNSTDALSHTYAQPGVYRVKLHYTAGEEVRPFRLGRAVTAIHNALPAFHPRTVETLGDFCGWAADRRELRSIPEDLFANNPTIVNLEQAFAGCVQLTDVADGIVSMLPDLKCTDGMFAFCKSLKALPASYLASPRLPRYDCFAGEATTETSDRNQETAA